VELALDVVFRIIWRSFSELFGVSSALRCDLGRTNLRWNVCICHAQSQTYAVGQPLSRLLRCHFGSCITPNNAEVLRQISFKATNHKFHYIAKALDYLPADTVLDGELVAMGPDGKPKFNLLQNFKSAESHITYYAFDVLMHKGRDLSCAVLSRDRRCARN